MDLLTLYRGSVAAWTDRLRGVRGGQWDAPTPCRDWTVRDLVNHVVGEEAWAVPLIGGRTIAEVGGTFDGDLLGNDPIGVAREAAAAADSAIAHALPDGGVVHLSYGDEDLAEYVMQLAADHLVHAWDLSAATGTARVLDPLVVTAVQEWFTDREGAYRGAGIIGPRGPSAGGAQADLLAGFGRDPSWGATHAALAAFSAAFGRGDVDAIMALMTDDCVFEATGPAPDGVRHEGAAAVRAVWVDLFTHTAGAAFTEEESFVSGHRGVLRWRFDWTNPDATAGHVRGVDILTFRDGRVCEKLSYVKG